MKEQLELFINKSKIASGVIYIMPSCLAFRLFILANIAIIINNFCEYNEYNSLQVPGSSSDPSGQSFSLSQRHDIGTHRPVLQRNSDDVQVRLSVEERKTILELNTKTILHHFT